ncbi:MAG: hypothetical protein OEX07_11090, partial [Gammaproteobacteria bacterium]|nr:hypothetical protein [Gammaproteobacteria bacterium]
MRTRLWLIIIGFVLSVMILPTYTLLYTEQGLNWIVQLVSQNIPGKLSINSVKGSFDSGIEIDQLRYQDKDVDIEISHGSFKWRPWKLTGNLLYIDTIEIGGVNVRITSLITPTTSATPGEATDLPQFTLPVRFILNDVILSDFHVYTNSVESLHFTNFRMNAKSHDDSVIVSSLIAETNDYNLTLNGNIKPALNQGKKNIRETKSNYLVNASGYFQIKELFNQPLTIKADLSGDLEKLETAATVTGFVQG